MFSNMFLIQAIGGLGYIIYALSYYCKEKYKILIVQIIGCIFFAIHYYLLNAKTGTICNILNIVTLTILFILAKSKNKKKRVTEVLYIIPFIVIIPLITYENIYSLLPIFASTVAILSFITDSENTIRGIGIISAICWLIYSIVYKSYVSIIFEAIMVTSTTIAYLKNRK